MNKIKFYSFLIAAILMFGACEEKALNPGDFSLPTELEVVQIYDTLGNEYPVQVLRSIDTTYLYPRIKSDTLKDENGIPVRDSNNKLQITRDTTYTPGTKSARFVELEPVLLAAPRNELHITLTSNARWLAPTPDFKGKIAWYLTQNVNGGGDATIKVKILAGLATKRRPVLAQQFIYSRDSLVMYKIVFDQKAQNEQ